MGNSMKRYVRHALVLPFVIAAFASIAACGKKEMTIEECRAKCTQVGNEQDAKCTMGKELCAEVRKKFDVSCEDTCKAYSEKYGGGK